MLEISLIFNIIYLINYIKFKFKYYKYKIQLLVINSKHKMNV